MTSFEDFLEEESEAPRELPREWDPKPHERAYYTHSHTGDRGWMVRRDGQDCIKLDRPNEDIVRRYQPSDWRTVQEVRPLTTMQLAQVAFAADRQLCLYLGRHELAKREWLDMKEPQRISWMTKGPGGEGPRADLFDAIMDALNGLAG